MEALRARTNPMMGNTLPTATDSQQAHKVSLERLRVFNMPNITIDKKSYDISNDCANEIIQELHELVENTKDASSRNGLLSEFNQYKKMLDGIKDTHFYPESMDIKQELNYLINTLVDTGAILI
jgi:ribosomal protein S15P/S13E